MNGCAIPDALMREMRSSVIFLGAILAGAGRRPSAALAAVSWGHGPLTCTSPGLRALGAEILDEGRARCAVRRKH